MYWEHFVDGVIDSWVSVSTCLLFGQAYMHMQSMKYAVFEFYHACGQVPIEFFQLCLGKRLKYSSCLYSSQSDSLETAEDQMLGMPHGLSIHSHCLKTVQTSHLWGTWSCWLHLVVWLLVYCLVLYC